jgi:hypothetical protein
MAEQGYSSAPARNSSRAAMGGGVKPGEISLGAAHKTTVDSSEGRAPTTPGKAVQGFSGTGTLKAFLGGKS